MNRRRRTLGVAILAQLGALLFVLKLAMAPLSNIEPVSLLVMVYAAVLGWWALAPVYLYILLEYAIWGVNIWSLCYLYVWLVLWALAWLLRSMRSRVGWGVLCGAFGLCFGALCALAYIPIGGWAYALTWWVSGIPFDLFHCAGNFVLALVLFQPLRNLLEKLLVRAGLKPPAAPKPKDGPAA